MPHLIDKETGLCVVCQRKDLTAVKEGKKYGRQNYDIRKLALDVITNKNDPHYREVLDRNYIKPNDNHHHHHHHQQSQAGDNDNDYNDSSIILTNKLPIKEHLVDKLSKNKKHNSFYNKNDDDDDKRVSSALEFRLPSPNKWRDTLRKVNLATASRFIETKNIDFDQLATNKPESRVKLVTPVEIIENKEFREIPKQRFVFKQTATPINVDLSDESEGEIIDTERSTRRIKTATTMSSDPRVQQKVFVEGAPVIINEKQQVQQQPQYVYKIPSPNANVMDTQPQQIDEIVAGQNFEQLTFNKNNPPPGVKRKRRIIVHEFAPPSPQPQVLNKQQPVRIVMKKPPSAIIDLNVNPNQKKVSLNNVQEDNESVSTDASSDIYPSASYKHTKKLLSGFHPYHDEESDLLALQCSTCCIGCWRRCSHRCTGCENFLSCPVYCWVGVFLPIFLILFIIFIIMILYAAHLF